jgi:hypothetical protein
MPVESSSPEFRIFLAHPKEWSDSQVDTACEKLRKSYEAGTRQAAARTGREPPKITVIGGAVDYRKRARNLGGFRGWSPSVTDRLTTGALRFTHIVVPTTPKDVDCVRVGRATAIIVRKAVDGQEHTVVAWDQERSLRRIVSVQEHDAENFSHGWELGLEKKP